MSDLIQDIAGFFETAPFDELVSWLIVACAEGRFDPVEVADSPSPAIQVQRAFERCGTRAQERLKQAVATSLGEWNLRAHGLHALRDLATVSAYLRASRCAPALRPHLEGVLLERGARYADDPAWHRTTAHVIAVLHGFAPHPEVEALFDRWFHEDTDPRYYPQFFIGLLACRPISFKELFPRLVDLVGRHRLEVPQLMAALVRTVGLRSLTRALPELGSRHQTLLLEWLSGGKNPPARIIIHHQHGDCLMDAAGGALHPIPLPGRVAYDVQSRKIAADPVGSIFETLAAMGMGQTAQPSVMH